MLPGMWTRTGISPFERLMIARGDIERLLNGEGQSAAAQWIPPMDVAETQDELICHLEVPGMTREDLEIRIEENVITISGEKRQTQQVEKDGLRHVERRFGRFERSMTVPANVDAERAQARYDNGILTVTLPKTEKSKPRRVSIEGSEKREIAGK